MTTLPALSWPSMPPVDLASEFHWIIHGCGRAPHHNIDRTEDNDHNDADNAEILQDELATPSENAAKRSKGRHPSSVAAHSASPYEIPLRVAKEPAVVISPAQLAAKTMLQIKLEMMQVSHATAAASSTIDDCSSPEATRSLTVLTNRKASLSTNSLTSASTGKETTLVRTASPERQMSMRVLIAPQKPLRRQSVQNRADLQLRQNQQRLAQWLSRAQKEDNSAEPRKRKSKLARRPQEHREPFAGGAHHHQAQADPYDPVKYSAEMEARIHAAMHQTLGRGFWEDPVTSVIAAEMTSESVFGGFVPTRRLAFRGAEVNGIVGDSNADAAQTSPKRTVHAIPEPSPMPTDVKDTSPKAPEPVEPHTASQLPTKPEQLHGEAHSSVVALMAADTREEALEQVEAGDVREALATLQAGIHQLLFEFQDNQDEIQVAGFNFSRDAHVKATTLQLLYRARHRHRLRHLQVLQRVWRGHRVRRQLHCRRAFEIQNVRAIQTIYRRHYERQRRERSACQIQNCFRIYRAQKHMVHLHQAVRKLVSQEKRKRVRKVEQAKRKLRVWVKLRAVLRFMWLRKIRYRSITAMQKHWKGRKSRCWFGDQLRQRSSDENARYEREQAFVQDRLIAIMSLYRRYLRETKRGRADVACVANRHWVRFRRLWRHWDSTSVTLEDKIRGLCALYPHGHRVAGRELAAVWCLLGAPLGSKRPATLVMTLEGVHQALADNQAPPQMEEQTTAANPGRVHRLMEIRRRARARWDATQWRAQQAWARQYWRMVIWPRKTLARWRRRKVAAAHATDELATAQERVWAMYLAQCFRVGGAGQRQPPFACDLCMQPFARARDHFAHVHEGDGKQAPPTVSACAQTRCRRAAMRVGADAEWLAVQQDVHFLRAAPLSLGANLDVLTVLRGSAIVNAGGQELDGATRAAWVWWLQMAQAAHATTETSHNGGPRCWPTALVDYLSFQLRPDVHPLARHSIQTCLCWPPTMLDTVEEHHVFQTLGFSMDPGQPASRGVVGSLRGLVRSVRARFSRHGTASALATSMAAPPSSSVVPVV